VLCLLALVFVPEFGWAGRVASGFPLESQSFRQWPDLPASRQSFAMGRKPIFNLVDSLRFSFSAGLVYRWSATLYRRRKLAQN